MAVSKRDAHIRRAMYCTILYGDFMKRKRSEMHIVACKMKYGRAAKPFSRPPPSI